jgi:hypothetical protein
MRGSRGSVTLRVRSVLARLSVLLYRLTSVTISGTVASQHGSTALIQNTNQIAL